MKLTAILTALCASTAFAIDIFQADGSIKAMEEGDLLPRQIPGCCSTNFNGPCVCPPAPCNSCGVRIS